MEQQPPQKPKRKPERNLLKKLPDFHDMFGPVDAFLYDLLNMSLSFIQVKSYELLENPWFKKKMESNLTKLYYKPLKEYKVSLGSLVEVKKPFSITTKENLSSYQKYMRYFTAGDKFMVLQISIDNEFEKSYPSIWITVLKKDVLIKVDAFTFASKIKAGLVEGLN